MAVYTIAVTTGDRLCSGTCDYIYVTLIGAEGQSERTLLDNWGPDLGRGSSGCYSVEAPKPLGELLLLRVEKDPFFVLPEDEWFCTKIVVTTPNGEALLFPCHRWVSRGGDLELRGGPARKIFEDTLPVLLEHRKKELEQRKQAYQYAVLSEGLPKCNAFKTGLKDSTENWKDFEELKSLFCGKTSAMYDYVTAHWQDDDFYGFQFLNGVNPNMIQLCSQLPPNFQVTDAMVKPFLQEGTSLEKEMKKGNIFFCDYKTLDGIQTRVYDGEQLVVATGFCLLYMNPENKLRPIAIQLLQQPAKENNIFLPSDSETDWLLAKMFIKNADSIHHQSINHLLNTHFVVHGCALATLRNLPLIHPLYKLLIPHFRQTFHINTLAQDRLKDRSGISSRVHQSESTYSSLCLPENMAARGLMSVPNFHYRDDGLELWGHIQSFAKAMVDRYYPSNDDVIRDSELQNWIKDIFTNTFLENVRSEQLAQFITMVIFRASAQHAAVHYGQFDYSGWAPNNPLLMRKPPPSTKGVSTMETIFETLPNQGETVAMVSDLWIVTTKFIDFVPLGSYPSEHFGEPSTLEIIRLFSERLASLGEKIAKRNAKLPVPYPYLHPAQMENSISV
ncbi:hypothetical protein NHX12_029515 [Muraenolepis orangiensis]|uniref:Hydroperoxide isomerase ALOXE3-like n=1 Tax=Muraenolepis orangiensis TaxID=630683 RepID=A0A9Q0D8E5_9TELE|nr:hypothetical protein NHX12_000090 [Muraenolepis orangiensis]KAJ3603426.1 hypothetical protein NHX12_029515 [Muraenolepis orangiensis]